MDASQNPEAERRLGTWLRGKYRLDRVIGEGGMATVYAATHRNNKRFAVKMLHPVAAAQPDIQTRFLREGYLANTVDHAGSVAVLDDDVSEEGIAFIVMELLDGQTVEALAPEGATRPSVPVSLHLGIQLMDTLAAAHGHGIVHRDIKPANLFLTRTGQLKVLDFGIARLRHPSSGASTTQAGVAMGTPSFMGPEQALGRIKDIDARTDVWAAGASLFWLLTGRTVHLADTVQHMMVRAATEPAPPLASVRPDLSPDVCGVIDRALAFDRAARWPSAAEMRDALRDVHAGLVGRPPVVDDLAGLARSDLPPREGDPWAKTSDDAAAAQSPGDGGLADTQFVDRLPSSPRGSADLGSTAVPVSSGPVEPRARRRSAVWIGVGVGVTLAFGAFAIVASRTPAPAVQAPHAATPPAGSLPEGVNAAASPPPTGVPAESAPIPVASATAPPAAASSVASPKPVAPPAARSAPRAPSSRPTSAPRDDFDRQ